MRKLTICTAVAAAALFCAGPSFGADAPGKTSPPPAKAPEPAAKFNHQDNVVKTKPCKDCHPVSPLGKGKQAIPAKKQ